MIAICFYADVIFWCAGRRSCEKVGDSKMRNAEYRCGMAVGLGLELLSWLEHGLWSGLGLYFAAVLHSFSQFCTLVDYHYYAFHIYIPHYIRTLKR